MNSNGMAVIALILFAAPTFGQAPTETKKFVLYELDRSCVCTKVKKETKTAIATEINVGNAAHKVVYQIF